MRIDKLELFKVPPRWLFLKITDSDGRVGWGEPIVEGKAETVRAAVEEMGEYLIGKPAGNIEDLWQTLYRGGFYRGGPVLMSAISGIEQALWDLKGKRFGVPVYELLGGAVREKMRVYSWIGGATAEAIAADARDKVAAGFTALKMGATEALEWIDCSEKVGTAVERMAAVRAAVGSAIGIGVDFHGRAHKGMAKVLIAELAPFKPMFIEEPVLPENNEALIELSRVAAVPLATGERMYSRWGFKAALAQGGVDILQPDVSHCGGIWELRKIAAMAESYDVSIAPHCPLGPITLASSLQVDFCTPNAIIQEQSLGIQYSQGSELLDYLVDPSVFAFDRGFVPLLTAPGLGIEIDENIVRERAQAGHNWRNPLWRNEDGVVTEW